MALAANATNMFKEELKSLTNTQDSISEVSTLMLIQWRYAKELVGVWGSQFEKAKDVKAVLALLYLAHEILMKAHKKKKTNILDAFADVLGKVIRQVLVLDTTDDELIESKLNKLVRIWKRSDILESSTISILEEILGISSRREDQNNDDYSGDEGEDKTLMDSENVKLIPEAEKILKTLKEINMENMTSEWLFDKVTNVQDKLELMERNQKNLKIETLDDDDEEEYDEEEDNEYVIDLVNAASILERYKTDLKRRLDRHNEAIDNMQHLQEVLPNLILKSKIVNEDEKLKDMSPKLMEYSTLYDKCCRKDTELTKKIKASNEKKRKREETKNIEVELIEKRKNEMMMNVAGGRGFGGLLSPPMSTGPGMSMVGGYGYGDVSRQQQQQIGQSRNSSHTTYQRYNNTVSNGYGRNNSRSSLENDARPSVRGRGRSMTVPAWMKRQ